MDLRLHFRVLSRFRYLVIGGLILAVALAFFSYFRVDLHGFKINPRQDETWQSSEVFLLTQKNSSLFTANPDASGSSGATSWLMTLPGFYAQIANSDVVGDVIRANHSLHGTYDAYQLFSSRDNSALPFLRFDANSATRTGAVRLANAAAGTFLSYVQSKQALQRIPASNRVVIQTITAPQAKLAVLVQPRKKTVPIIVFLATIIGTLGLCYILENLRPSATTEAPAYDEEVPAARPHVRSAAGGKSSNPRGF